MGMPHDLGGKPGFGPVAIEADEPTFHARWEGVTRALQQVVSRATQTTIDERRHAIERMDPEDYLAASYYERWLMATATLAVEHGLVTKAELEERAGVPFRLSRPAVYSADFVPAADPPAAPRYPPGTRVRVSTKSPLGHCRCPEYARGRTGVVGRCDGPYPLPDLVAHGRPGRLDYCDNVVFEAGELFEDGDPTARVHIDLFEVYLEEAR